MKKIIALLTLLVVLIPAGMAVAQTPANLYDTLAACINHAGFLAL